MGIPKIRPGEAHQVPPLSVQGWGFVRIIRALSQRGTMHMQPIAQHVPNTSSARPVHPKLLSEMHTYAAGKPQMGNNTSTAGVQRSKPSMLLCSMQLQCIPSTTAVHTPTAHNHTTTCRRCTQCTLPLCTQCTKCTQCSPHSTHAVHPMQPSTAPAALQSCTPKGGAAAQASGSHLAAAP